MSEPTHAAPETIATEIERWAKNPNAMGYVVVSLPPEQWREIANAVRTASAPAAVEARRGALERFGAFAEVLVDYAGDVPVSLGIGGKRYLDVCTVDDFRRAHALTLSTPAGPAPTPAAGEPKRLAEGCCSAVTPCNHQKASPNTICETCQKAAAGEPELRIMEDELRLIGRIEVGANTMERRIVRNLCHDNKTLLTALATSEAALREERAARVRAEEERGVLNDIRNALEARGWVHCANGESIGHLVDRLEAAEARLAQAQATPAPGAVSDEAVEIAARAVLSAEYAETRLGSRRWEDASEASRASARRIARAAIEAAHLAPGQEWRPISEAAWTLADLRRANIDRQAAWCPEQVPDLSFRGNELGGEAGEAQNVIKKLERERLGWRGSRATLDDLAQELADVVICADLVGLTAGVDLYAAVRAKFDATSEKVGLPHRLVATPPTVAEQTGERP